MKFSDAIREGQKFPDVTSTYIRDTFDPKTDAPICHTCAIGGALICALGDKLDHDSAYNAIKLCEGVWPELKDLKIECPLNKLEDGEDYYTCSEGGCEELDEDGKGNPFSVASHLFSDHKWSKAKVAKWVESAVEKSMSK